MAVCPHLHGRRIGRQLLQLAEAEAVRQGFDSIYLYTNERMSEDQALYGKIGYVEYDRRVIDGYRRVFLRKRLS